MKAFLTCECFFYNFYIIVLIVPCYFSLIPGIKPPATTSETIHKKKINETKLVMKRTTIVDVLRNNVDEHHSHVTRLLFETLCKECGVDLKFTHRLSTLLYNIIFSCHVWIPKVKHWFFKVWTWEFASQKEFEDYYRTQEKAEAKEVTVNSAKLKVSSLTVLDLVRQNLHMPSKDLALLVLDRMQEENSVELKHTKRLEVEIERCTSVMQRNLVDEDGNLETFHFRILASEFVKEEQFDKICAKEMQTECTPPSPWLPATLPVHHTMELRGKGRLFICAIRL